jgi:hypothetical protein
VTAGYALIGKAHMSKSKKAVVKAKAVKPQSKPNLDPVEEFDANNIPALGGVWLDDNDNLYLSRDSSKPKPCTLHAALEFLAERWKDGGSGFTDGNPNYERFFKLLANKVPALHNESEQMLIALEVLASAKVKPITIQVPISLKSEYWLTIQIAANAEKKSVGEIVSTLIANSDDLTELWDEYCDIPTN